MERGGGGEGWSGVPAGSLTKTEKPNLVTWP